MNKKDRTRKIAVTAVMASVSVVLGLTRLGFIPWFSGASLTIMHVPVILAAVLEGPWAGLFTGLIFGIFSMVNAAVMPTGPLDVFFVNPLVSLLPRLAVALVSWGLYASFREKKLVAGICLAAFGGSLTNTMLVLGALGLMKAIPRALFLPVFLVNGLPEAAAAALICLGVVLSWQGLGKRNQKAKLIELEDED